jgi:CubicO group peptidase (beta-lactamase class C family)
MAAARALILGVALSVIAIAAEADPAVDARFDAIVRPTGFSGAILISKDGVLLFDKAYGLADTKTGAPNRSATSFHVGVLSMRYTAVTVLHLVETHKLSLDNTAGQVVAGLPPALGATTLRALLETPPHAQGAVAAYEILARVVAAASGKDFATAQDAAAFGTVWMAGTGLDDGTHDGESRLAGGTAADGAQQPPDGGWASMEGAASVFTTTRDELHWLDLLFGEDLISKDSFALLAATPSGYGWTHAARAGGEAWWSDSTIGGFGAYVLRVPSAGLSVIVLGNNDHDAKPLGEALAAEAVASSGR